MTEQPSEEIERIRQQAVLLTQRPDSPEIREYYLELLQACQDRAALEEFAERVTLNPEVAVPVYERLLQFDPANASLIVRLGFILFMYGEDEAAAERLRQAKAIEGETVQVLKLEAMLAREDEEKRRLYTRIMTMDPSDREIWQYLIALKK